VLGSAAAQDPPKLEVTRVERDGEPLALHVRSPEPLDWGRTGLELLRADRRMPIPSPPGDLKLTDVAFGTSQPNEESVTLLLRETMKLNGQRIEYRAPLLNEPFDSSAGGRWRPWDEGNQEVPSQWAVLDGELQQTSNIYGGDPNSAERPGTLALAGEFTWANYGLSVYLRSDNAEGDIGAVFRYQNEQNYYRFSMGQVPAHRRLIRKSGGTVSTLWEDTEGYVPGREYALTIECVGGRLTGSLDEELIFDIEDSTLPEGCIGLYCWRNPAARFAEVQVVPSGWAPYYTFGEEARLPAGTRVRVHPGNVRDAPPEESGVIRRFAASGVDGGQLRLTSGGAELRLVLPGDAEGHRRHYLSSDAYAPVSEARFLRKADGTGFFVLAPTSSSAVAHLASGQYRLELTYRRDNSGADSESLVLSEAGNTTPERATIDIPWYVR
jgi:hypothetical protein